MPRLGTLTTALRPPRAPREPPTPEDWQHLERALGTALPTTFKDFVVTYGTGTISGYIRVLNPFSAGDAWLPWLANAIAADAHAHAFDARSRWPSKRRPPPPFPADGGLLPFAKWGSGALLHYWTRGVPDDWPIVWCPIGSFDHLVFKLPLTKLLEQLLRGKLREPALGVEYPTLQRGATFVQPAKAKKSPPPVVIPQDARERLEALVERNQGSKFVPYKATKR